MKITGFLPSFLWGRLTAEPWIVRRHGAVLFADVSGFTPLSERLAPLGAEGAERLTDILNIYFADMIGIVHSRGGEVMKFGGDAILCFFPETGSPEPETAPSGDESRETKDGRQDKEAERQGDSRNSKFEIRNLLPESLSRALTASGEMQTAMERFQSIPTPNGRLALGMKVGLARGTVLLGGVGDPEVRCDYLFAGRPVDLASEAEHHAARGEVVLAEESAGPLPKGFETQPAGRGFRRVVVWSAVAPPPVWHGEPEICPDVSALRPYLIGEVFDRAAESGAAELGALRSLVPVFLQFHGFDFTPGRLDFGRFHAFFTAVMELTHRYLGRLNRISMGDKGSTFLLLFGAPVPLEKAEHLASQWGLELLKLVDHGFPGVTVRAGMHTGRAFAGVVGGSGRWDYTVMGDTINTAARLMSEAGDGAIAVSDEFRDRAASSFILEDAGERILKGKRAAVRVHRLIGRSEKNLSRRVSRLFGREAEQEALREFLGRARSGSPGLAALSGEPGMGTSLLAAQMAEEASADGWLAVIGRGEITTRNRPYAAWMDLFRALLFGCLEPTEEVLRERVRRAGLDWTMDAPPLRRFFGLPSKDGGVENLVEEHSRVHRLLSRLTLDASRRRPVLLWLDDLHWFDSLSLDLLKALLGQFRDDPIAVLASARPGPALDAIGLLPQCRTVRLGPLGFDAVRRMAEERLGEAAREELVLFLLKRTAGSPFYTDRLLTFLKEAGHLERRPDGWTVSRRAADLRLESGSEIVTAEVERLPATLRLHLNRAACMGPSLSVAVLARVLGRRYDPSAVERLIGMGMLEHEGPARIRFTQGVLQEALYAAQLARVRKAAHRRIGRAMESEAGAASRDIAPNLSNHFFLGGVRSKAATYAMEAARNLWSVGSYPEAHHYFSRAWGLLRRVDIPARWEAGLWTGRAALSAGRMVEGLEHVRTFRHAARRAGKRSEAAEALLQEFHLRHRMGDQGYAVQAARLLRTGDGALRRRKSELAYLVGAARFRQGRFEEASAMLRKASIVRGSAPAGESALAAVLFLASIEKRFHRWEAALKVLHRGMEMAGRAGCEQARLKFAMEEANLRVEQGDPAGGRQLLLHCLPEIERTGDAYLLAVALLNLGFLDVQTGAFASADRSLEEAARLFGNLGVPNGRAKALMNRGISAFSQGCAADSVGFYAEATRGYEALGEAVETAYGYYNLAEACLSLGRQDEARDWITRAKDRESVNSDPDLRSLFDALLRKVEAAPSI